MVSVLFFYANNRQLLFEYALDCLERIELWKQCEKIVCSDGPTKFRRDGYKVIEVTRPRRDYNWAAVWQAGVEAASHEYLWYLDCDRIVPVNYLTEALKLLKPKEWVYPRNTLRLTQVLGVIDLMKVQDGYNRHFVGEVEPRVDNPPSTVTSQPGKNPFSGNALFTKTEFLASGGLNPAFDGYGYADIDYYQKMHQLGQKFVICPLDEYHEWHTHAVDNERDRKMMYYNGFMYCKNWNLRPHDMLIGNCLRHGIRFQDVKANTRFCNSVYDKALRML